MTHTIRILAVNKHKEIEWREVVKSSTKSGATRKANNIIRSCGLDNPKIEKRNQSTDYEYWTI